MNEREKYFIDLSKLSEEQRKSLPQILDNAGENIYEETLDDLLNDRFDEEYIYLAQFFDGEWLRFKDNLNRTELTYPDFIKLFEGGEGENNGWIKIESEADLPKNSINERKKNNLYFVYSELKSKLEYQTKNLFSLYSMFQQGLITHYQPIIKPEPPKF